MTKPDSGGHPSAPMAAFVQGRLARILYIAHRLLQKLSGGHAALHAYLLCAQPIGSGHAAALRADATVVVKTVTQEDPLTAQFTRPPAVIRRRFEQGATCWAMTIKQVFAGHAWLARDAYEEDEVRCCYRLPQHPPSVWDYDVYVEPRFRAGRAMARLWAAVDSALHAEGVAWTFSRISFYNQASVRSHERMGAVRVGTAVFLVLGPLQVTLLSQAPYVHLGVRARQRPEMALCAPAWPGTRVACTKPGATATMGSAHQPPGEPP